MQLVSILSDFGAKDYYLAQLKASLWSQVKDIQVLDIAHEIPLHDIALGAFYLKNVLPRCPEGCIFILAVHNFYDQDCRYLACEYEGHYFIAPDNGIFSLIFPEERMVQFFQIDPSKIHDSNLLRLYSHAVAMIYHRMPLQELGPAVTEIERKLDLRPVITGSQIRASIIHIDCFENVVINLTREQFEKSRDGRKFKLFYKQHDPITEIVHHYGDVGPGEVLARFTEVGYLEIAVYMGKASSNFHLNKNETIQIDFY